MSKSVDDELEALRQAVEQFPENGLRASETTREKLRWADLDQHLDTPLAGQRVLVVGGDTGYDASAFAQRGADCVLASDLQDLDPARLGTFDIVHCNGLLHRVLDPVGLLRALREMTATGGMLLIGSMMLDDPERSEYLRFIPDRYAGDRSWWFVPGRLALRWMLQTAGYTVEAEFGQQEGQRDGFPVVSGYLRAVAR